MNQNRVWALIDMTWALKPHPRCVGSYNFWPLFDVSVHWNHLIIVQKYMILLSILQDHSNMSLMIIRIILMAFGVFDQWSRTKQKGSRKFWLNKSHNKVDIIIKHSQKLQNMEDTQTAWALDERTLSARAIFLLWFLKVIFLDI